MLCLDEIWEKFPWYKHVMYLIIEGHSVADRSAVANSASVLDLSALVQLTSRTAVTLLYTLESTDMADVLAVSHDKLDTIDAADPSNTVTGDHNGIGDHDTTGNPAKANTAGYDF